MDMPGVLTVDDMLMRALGMGGSPMGALLGPMIKPMLYGALGLESSGQRDALLDFVVSSNMTPFGTAMELRNRQYTRIATANMQRMQQASMQNWLTNFSKTTMSYNSWRAARIAAGANPAALTNDDYELAMSNQARGWANNPLWSMVYKGFDPDGMVAASEYLQMAGANIARRASIRGQRNAFAQARAVTGLFTDAKGNDIFDQANYGYMGRGEVAAVTAALTRDLDFFGGSSNLTEATRKLRTTVQEYTKALSPLKDVFGKDVPAMIKAVEELSGRSFTNMGANAVSRMVRQVLDGATAGNYTMQQVADMSNAWRGALLQTNVPFLNDLASTSVATNILNATVPAGAAPRYMSQARWENMAGDHIRRASVSRGGEMFAQAYAVMLQNNRELTFEQFMNRYNNSYNGSIEGTLYAMAGARNAADLQRLAGASGMLPQAYENNINTLASLEMGARVSRTRLRDRLRAQGYGLSAINEALGFFDRSANMDFEAVANSSLSAGGRAVANSLLSLDMYQSDMTNLRTLYTNQEAARRTQRVARAREAAEQINFLAPGSLAEAVTKFIGGASWDDLKRSNRELLQVSNPEAMADMKAVVEAAGLAASSYGLSNTETIELAENAVRFRFSDGITSEKYLEWLDKYKRAKPGSKERRLAAKNMLLYQYGDQDRLDKYWQRHKNGTELRGRMSDIVNLGDAGSIRAELSDFLIGDELKDVVMRNKELDSRVKEQILANIDSATAASGMMSSADWTTALTKGSGGAALATTDQALQMKEAAGIQAQSMESLLTDKFNILEGLGKAINELVEQLKKNETRDNTAPTGGE